MLSSKTIIHRVFKLLATAIAYLAWSYSASANDNELYLDPSQSVAQYVSCLANQNVTLVSAHRGGPKPGFPENALESLQEAVKLGPMLLEIDVRETADGHLVLLHDDTLERTTTGTGKLKHHTLAEIKQLFLVDNDGNPTSFRVPTLVEVLEWADDKAIVQLDVKRGVDYQKVARAVVEADAIDSALIVAYRLENAVASLAVDKRLNFSYSISKNRDLSTLAEKGLPPQQIVAWTGVVEQNDKPIWPVLEKQGIPSAAGAFWHLEKQIIKTGNTQPYLDLASNGIDVIASDNYWLAYQTLEAEQNMPSALTNCKGK